MSFDYPAGPGGGPFSVQHPEVVRHVEFVSVAVIGRPLLALQVDLADREPRPIRRELVQHRPDLPEQPVYVRVTPVVDMYQPVVVAQVLVTVLRALQHRIGSVLGILHGKVTGVQPEALHTTLEPEPEGVEHRLLHRRIPPVQVGLLGEETVQVVLAGVVVVGPCRSAEHRNPVVGLGSVGCRVPPHVPVAPGVVAGGAGLSEPGMHRRRMVGNPVDDHLETQVVCPVNQGVEVIEGAEDRVHVNVVGHVVTEVGHG